MDILASLNQQQRDAAQTIDGPLLILAGPGSGKTRTLTHRIAYLISRGISPRSILAVTFTNKAAGEMKERVAQLLAQTDASPTGPPSQMPTMGTFHSVCVRLLREHAALIGYSPQFTIFDASDQQTVLKQAMKELGIDPKQITPNKIAAIISGAKDELLLPEMFVAQAGTYLEREAARVYERYQTALAEANAFDFDDLIMQTVLLLKTNEAVRTKLQRRFRYILVDEYQDTNTAQYTLVMLLAQGSGNICVVGDDAQAIYSWRNANFENILNFERDWPAAKVIKLEQNYRSSKRIVEAASALIANNDEGYPKNLWTHNTEGEPIAIQEVLNEREEGEFILATMHHLVEERKLHLRDMVVLYRTNAQSRALEETFLRAGVPYKIVGGTKFYERAEVKDAIAWLRLLHNPHDFPAFDRLAKLRAGTLRERLIAKPARKKEDVVRAMVNEISDRYAQGAGTLLELLTFIINKTSTEKLLRDGTDKGEERWQNVLELQSVTQEYDTLALNEALAKFLEDVTLMQETDNIRYENDLVHLMTLHMAKGLEFPVVFMAGCEEGILPHASSMSSARELEEERRLCYVGITRAKEKLYMLFARHRMLWGSTQSNPPSNFLFELPQEHLSFEPLQQIRESDTAWDEDVLEW
ncbi:MAG: UvrD-helicase domain-containing protein [Candidatus Spechtbacterales bacterium]